jgi:hypothetical protein
MSQVLHSKLTGVQYHADNTSGWTTEIADEIKTKLKGEPGASVSPHIGTEQLGTNTTSRRMMGFQ